jgi:hypothetical protein
MNYFIYIILVIILLFNVWMFLNFIKWIEMLYDRVQKPQCHYCGCETEIEFICEKCDEFYCEKCSSTFNQFTQIDYNCCQSCANAKNEY